MGASAPLSTIPAVRLALSPPRRDPGRNACPKPMKGLLPYRGVEPVREGQWVDLDLWFVSKDPPRAAIKEPHEEVPQKDECLGN